MSLGFWEFRVPGMQGCDLGFPRGKFGIRKFGFMSRVYGSENVRFQMMELLGIWGPQGAESWKLEGRWQSRFG